jgi:ABC-type nitrate/sulfonate/bicarbonate transport system substrate-binding protein
MVRRIAALVIGASIVLGLVSFGVSGYEGDDEYRVTLNGPSGRVQCGRSVQLRVVVTYLGGPAAGEPVAGQTVRWTLDRGSGRLDKRTTRTDRNGRTETTLTIADSDGARRVTASSGGASDRLTIQVFCPQPTPRPTQRPEPRATPRPTPRPTKRPTPRPTRRPQPPAALTIGYQDPELPGRAPLLLAQANGLLAANVIDQVDIVPPVDGIASVLDGTLDAAIVPTAAVIAAVDQGLPIVILAANRNYGPDVLAVSPGVAAPADLSGRATFLGDGVASSRRLAALTEAGFSLDGVDVAFVTPEGGPDDWMASLLAGDVGLIPILNRQRLQAQQAGATLVLDQQAYGGDLLVTSRSSLDADPDVFASLQAVQVAALQAIIDPANDPPLYEAAEAAGIAITDAVKSGWAIDVEDSRPWDGGFGELGEGDGLQELDAYAHQLVGHSVALRGAIALDGLAAAQGAAGLEPNPIAEGAVPETPSAAPSASPSA